MTILVLAAMLAVWVIVQGAGFSDALVRSVCNLGLVPGELTGRAPVNSGIPIAPGLFCAVDGHLMNWATPVLSMFLHGSWMHLIGNALFLWVFGNNIEDVTGPIRFLAFYLICGIAAAGAHVFFDPASPVPTVGASGAISGVMGAYLVLFPRVRVRMFFYFGIFYRIIPVEAWAVLIWWFVLQVIPGLMSLDRVGEPTGGVAFWAHVGGFVAGAALIRLFVRSDLVDDRRSMLLRRGLLPSAT